MTYSVNGITVIDINRNVTVASANVNANIQYPSNDNLFQGMVAGYTSGGNTPPGTNTIDKFPFSTDANASDVGDLTIARERPSGQSSSVSGYTSGGQNPPTAPSTNNAIDKFPFATNTNATNVGLLTESIIPGSVGQSSTVSGYRSGGRIPGTPIIPPVGSNVIDKFPFSTDANATDVGDLTIGRWDAAGQSSTVSGYTSGGGTYSPSSVNVIDKFPFSTNANATDVGDLTVGKNIATAGQSSTVSGYVSGQSIGPGPTLLNIEKFPFATDSNSSVVGGLLNSSRGYASGQSSTVSGYVTAGDIPVGGPGIGSNIIEKFSFATDSNSADVGDLTITRRMAAGQQD